MTCIKKYNMASRLIGVQEVYRVLKDWRDSNPETFRIDGHNAIGPANPAQWIFFEIQEFSESDFSGEELGRVVTGEQWNGIYYLTASTRGKAIDHFIYQYENTPKVSDVFVPTYTAKKEGLPGKRRLHLNNATDEVNSGWFCKQFVKRY